MSSTEIRTSQLSFFGRLADDLTREVILPPAMAVFLEDDRRESLNKSDGYFVFADLKASPTDYRIRIGAPSYQDRSVAKALSSAAPVEVTFAGEDELYLSITGVSTPENRVTFEQLTFVPLIEAGASVIGQAGFTATLTEPLEGQKVSFAVLSTVAGLAANQLLRIVRSRNLLVRAGPHYAFPAGTTVLAVKVVEDGPAEAPVGGTAIEIRKINSNAPTTVDVGGLNLHSFSLTSTPPTSVVLDDDDRNAVTNDRGDAVFYFSGSKSITNIEVNVSKARYQNATSAIDITTKIRSFQRIVLQKL